MTEEKFPAHVEKANKGQLYKLKEGETIESLIKLVV